jgi:hypothetical protein
VTVRFKESFVKDLRNIKVLWFTRNGHLNKGDKIGKGGDR